MNPSGSTYLVMIKKKSKREREKKKMDLEILSMLASDTPVMMDTTAAAAATTTIDMATMGQKQQQTIDLFSSIKGAITHLKDIELKAELLEVEIGKAKQDAVKADDELEEVLASEHPDSINEAECGKKVIDVAKKLKLVRVLKAKKASLVAERLLLEKEMVAEKEKMQKSYKEWLNKFNEMMTEIVETKEESQEKHPVQTKKKKSKKNSSPGTTPPPPVVPCEQQQSLHEQQQQQQPKQQRGGGGKESAYTGVFPASGGGFVVRVGYGPEKRVKIKKVYKTEEQAARAFDRCKVYLRGRAAKNNGRLNFPDDLEDYLKENYLFNIKTIINLKKMVDGDESVSVVTAATAAVVESPKKEVSLKRPREEEEGEQQQ